MSAPASPAAPVIPISPTSQQRRSPPASYISTSPRTTLQHNPFSSEMINISSSSRPPVRRMSSQSDMTASTSQRSSVSTAPTTPLIGPRLWRPTPNVPQNFQRRTVVDDDVDERNRWLSEDEGTGGVARTIGRRRRRQSSSGSGDGAGPSQPPNPGPSDPGGPGPSTLRRLENKSGGTKVRPSPRRARSFEPTRQLSPPRSHGAADITTSGVGREPPRIQDIVPQPMSPTQIMGLGIDSNQVMQETSTASGVDALSDTSGIPDYARGRGGDGISAGMPIGGIASDVDLAVSAQQQQSDLLGKLERVLGCALCPSDRGSPPWLHHPITLPCGHTLSAAHLSLPSLPPLTVTSTLPHEIFAAQQKQHQQRLNLWAGVMCPIPTCKRYSATASSTSVADASPLIDVSLPASSGTQRGDTSSSGVTYYPPPPDPSTFVLDAAANTHSPLLDISVEKVLNLVKQEIIRRETIFTSMRSSSETDTDDSDDEDLPQSGLSLDLSQLSHQTASVVPGPPSPLTRRSSKRLRNGMALPAPPVRARSGTPDDWPFRKDLASVVECDVCAMMLYEPVTTPCQHSFCSKCLSRSLDHSSRCPLCRQDLPSFAFFQDHSVNRVLLTVIKTVFPEEYAERCRSLEQEERDARLDTPIFVCTLAFPGMPTILHVFEPRYRLMIRRCIESSNPRFGMVLPARGTGAAGVQGVMDYGTMLEIQSVQMLPDGRSMVETVGTHRFKLLEKGSLDGYTVGRIERIDDISPEEEEQLQESAVRAAALRSTSSQTADVSSTVVHVPQGPLPAEEAVQTTEEYMAICQSFIEQLRSGSAPWLLQRLNNTYGTMPTDPNEFSYWMALVMPIDEYEKARLLPIRSPRLRLKLIVHWVESLRSSWWFSSG